MSGSLAAEIGAALINGHHALKGAGENWSSLCRFGSRSELTIGKPVIATRAARRSCGGGSQHWVLCRVGNRAPHESTAGAVAEGVSVGTGRLGLLRLRADSVALDRDRMAFLDAGRDQFGREAARAADQSSIATVLPPLRPG